MYACLKIGAIIKKVHVTKELDDMPRVRSC